MFTLKIVCRASERSRASSSDACWAACRPDRDGAASAWIGGRRGGECAAGVSCCVDARTSSCRLLASRLARPDTTSQGPRSRKKSARSSPGSIESVVPGTRPGLSLQPRTAPGCRLQGHLSDVNSHPEFSHGAKKARTLKYTVECNGINPLPWRFGRGQLTLQVVVCTSNTHSQACTPPPTHLPPSPSYPFHPHSRSIESLAAATRTLAQRSKRSEFITFAHAAAKSSTKAPFASSHA